MTNMKSFIIINPAAEADVTKMNEILQADSDYIIGVEFTYSEVIDGGSVQFFYNYPEELTLEQKTNAQQLVKKIYTNFMTSRIVTS